VVLVWLFVKKIVESAQGTIRFESQQGVGTVFYIELPLILS
jgi:signal transduction histidine kinase